MQKMQEPQVRRTPMGYGSRPCTPTVRRCPACPFVEGL